MSQTLDGFASEAVPQGGDGFGYDPYAVDVGDTDITPSGFVDREGLYHLAVEKVEPGKVEPGKPRVVEVHMKVMNDIPGQSPFGSKFNFDIFTTAMDGSGPPEEWSRKRTANFFIGAGVARREKRGEKSVMVLADGSNRLGEAHFKSLVGRQFWGPMKFGKEFTKKDGTKGRNVDLNFGEVFPLWDDRFSRTPAGEAMYLDMAGCHVVNGVIVRKDAPAGTSQQQPAKAAASSDLPDIL